MTETLDKKIEKEMAILGSLERIRRSMDTAKTEDEKYNLTDAAIQVLASTLNPDSPNIQEKLEIIERDLYINPYRHVKQTIGNRLESFEKDYKSNQDKIYTTIEGKFNEELSKVDASKKYSKNEAVNAILPYLSQAIEISEEESEEDKDNLYAKLLEEISEETKMPIVGDYRNIINPSKNKVFKYRALAAELIKEIKGEEGKITAYEVDSEKLKKIVENPLIGSILYHAKKPEKKKDK